MWIWSRNVIVDRGRIFLAKQNAMQWVSFFEVYLKRREDGIKWLPRFTLGRHPSWRYRNWRRLAKKTTYLGISAKFLFAGLFRLIGLPFLPTFSMISRVKTTTKLNDKTWLTFIRCRRILTKFVLNQDAAWRGNWGMSVPTDLYFARCATNSKSVELLPTALKLKRFRRKMDFGLCTE